MKHRMVVVAVCLAVVPMLLGANIALQNGVPNPGNQRGTLNMDGTYQLGMMETVDRIIGFATVVGTNPPLAVDRQAAWGNGQWSVTLQPIAAATYDCAATMRYVVVDPANMQSRTEVVVSNIIQNVVVK